MQYNKNVGKNGQNKHGRIIIDSLRKCPVAILSESKYFRLP